MPVTKEFKTIEEQIAYNFASVYCKSAEDTMNYINPAFYKASDASNKHMCNIFSSFDLFRKTQFFPNGKVKKKSFIDELKKDKDYVNQYEDPPFWVVIKALPLGSKKSMCTSGIDYAFPTEKKVQFE